MKDGQHTSNNLGDGGEFSGEAEIGRFLEQKRRERGLSLEDVEQATKIRKRYLTGLEREDFAMLPDAVYAQGFLKTYANYLGLDGEELSRQLKSRRKPRRERGINYNRPPESVFERPLIAPGGLTGTEKRKMSTSAVVALIVALLALAAVIGTLYFVGRAVQASHSQKWNPPAASKENPPRRDQQEVAAKDKKPGAGHASERVDDKGLAGAHQSAPPDKLLVLVSVKDRPSWILILADGNTAYEQIAQPGFSKTFEADRQLYIKSGDAGAVRVQINGQDVGALGPAGHVVAKSYTLKNAS